MAPAEGAYHIPAGLGFPEATVAGRHFPVAYAQIRRVGLQPGETALVMGATGGPSDSRRRGEVVQEAPKRAACLRFAQGLPVPQPAATDLPAPAIAERRVEHDGGLRDTASPCHAATHHHVADAQRILRQSRPGR